MMVSNLRPDDQPGPRPTLPTGGRISTLQFEQTEDVFCTIKCFNQSSQSAHPGSAADHSVRPSHTGHAHA